MASFHSVNLITLVISVTEQGKKYPISTKVHAETYSDFFILGIVIKAGACTFSKIKCMHGIPSASRLCLRMFVKDKLNQSDVAIVTHNLKG